MSPLFNIISVQIILQIIANMNANCNITDYIKFTNIYII